MQSLAGAMLASVVALAACSRSVTEKLESATPVASVESHGLHLSDGRFVGWGLAEPVPTELAALDAITAHGIEIGTDGRAIGLVQVHHWCGNDPIREHLARIDVGHLLEFLGGRPTPEGEEPLDFTEADTQFTQWGWNVSSWRASERWRGTDPDCIYK
jgi:hypothetical protein